MRSSKFIVFTFISVVPLVACGGRMVIDHGGSVDRHDGGDAGNAGGATSTLEAGAGGAAGSNGAGEAGAVIVGSGGSGGRPGTGGSGNASGGATSAPPFTVSIQRLGCFGDCADIEAAVTSNQFLQYGPFIAEYVWDDGSTNAVRHVCPTPMSSYEVAVTGSGFDAPGRPPQPPTTVKASLSGSAIGCADLDGGANAATQDASTAEGMAVAITGSPMNGFYRLNASVVDTAGPFDFSADSIQGTVEIGETGIVLSPGTTATTPRVKLTLTFGTVDDGVYPANGAGTCTMSTTSTVWPNGRTDFVCNGLVGIVSGQTFSLSGSLFVMPI